MSDKEYYIIEDGIKYTVLEKFNGTAQWWRLNNKLHRLSGPALICPNGDTWWYFEGLIHREDGPAASDRLGLYKMWYYKDKWINVSSQKEFARFLKLKAFW